MNSAYPESCYNNVRNVHVLGILSFGPCDKHAEHHSIVLWRRVVESRTMPSQQIMHDIVPLLKRILFCFTC